MTIADTHIDKALLDLGVVVSISYPTLFTNNSSWGELKKTYITLSLVDRSIKVARGVVEDVLVQVKNFCYLVDFVVLSIELSTR